jgi:hypothetical protein
LWELDAGKWRLHEACRGECLVRRIRGGLLFTNVRIKTVP